LLERQINKQSLYNQLEVWEIDPREKPTSAKEMAVEVKDLATKNQVLKQLEESRKHSFLIFFLSDYEICKIVSSVTNSPQKINEGLRSDQVIDAISPLQLLPYLIR
jgi:hypothetical protein